MESSGTAGEVAVLVASCDAYCDLWGPFFELFRRYWPDCPYPVYLGSNFLTCARPGVGPLTVGDDVDWSTGFAEMLRRVEEPHVLVLLEDFLLSAPADTARIGRLLGYMTARAAACIRLMPVPGAPAPAPDFGDAGDLPRGMPYRMSLQAAIWRRDVLLGLLRPGESAWQLELDGTSRTEALAAPFLSVLRDRPKPLPYFCNAVIRGVWRRDALALCRREAVHVNLDIRPAESFRVYARRRLKQRLDQAREWSRRPLSGPPRLPRPPQDR